MPSSAAAYIAEFTDKIHEAGGNFREDPAIRLAELDDFASLRGTAMFESGHRLYLVVVVDTSAPVPTLLKYSFHFVDPEGGIIFRYDNAPTTVRSPRIPPITCTRDSAAQ